MTRLSALLLASAFATMPAGAGSSIVAPAPPAAGATPSIVALAPIARQPKPEVAGLAPDLDRFLGFFGLASDAPAISASMVALGEAVPAVTNETVASTTPEASPFKQREPVPLMIRGGLASIGNPAPEIAITTSEPTGETSEEKPGEKTGDEGEATPQASQASMDEAPPQSRRARERAGRNAAAAPAPAPQPAAAPTSEPR